MKYEYSKIPLNDTVQGYLYIEKEQPQRTVLLYTTYRIGRYMCVLRVFSDFN